MFLGSLRWYLCPVQSLLVLFLSRCWLARRFGEATTFFLPLVFVVLFVRHDLEDKHLLAGVKNPCDQPVFVAADIENDAVANQAGLAKVGLYISPGMPGHGFFADVRMPRPQRSLGILVVGAFPELPESSF